MPEGGGDGEVRVEGAGAVQPTITQGPNTTQSPVPSRPTQPLTGCSRGQQLLAHVCAQLYAKLLHRLLVVLDLLHPLRHPGGHRGLAEACHALEAPVRHDGHDAGQDGAGDAHAAAVLHKLHAGLEGG